MGPKEERKGRERKATVTADCVTDALQQGQSSLSNRLLQNQLAYPFNMLRDVMQHSFIFPDIAIGTMAL